MQDKTDSGYAVAYNVGFGMPDGTEVVTNGSFATDTDWTKSDAALTISGGKANWSGAQAGNADLGQASILTSGEVYKVTWTTSGRTAGTAQLLLGTTTGTAQSTNDTFTEYIAANGTDLDIRGNSTFDGSVDDVSIEQLTTGRNLVQNPFFDTDTVWIKGSWTIGGGKASAGGITGGFYQNPTVTVGVEYEVIFKVSGYVGGSVTPYIGGKVGTAASADGIFTERITATSANYVIFLQAAAATLDIEFVIVRPVSSATNGRYARQICLNGFFANWTGDDPDDWTVTEVGNPTSNITENPAGHCQIISDGTAASIAQTILAVGKQYVVTVHVATVASGSLTVTDGTFSTTLTSVGVHKMTFAASATTLTIQRTAACDITIDYVRVEQILIEPSSAYSTPGDNPLDLTNTAISIQQPSGNARVGVMMGGNGTTSKALPGLAEMNSLFPKDKGAIRIVGLSNTWAAGTDYLFYFGADANNAVYGYRNATNIIVGYKAGGTAEEITIASGSPAGPWYLGLDWDTDGSGAVRAIWNGVQSGATQTIAGTFAGNLAATLALYFAASSTPTSVWDGDGAHAFWLDDIPTAAEDLAFAQVLGLA
jgi:hypothetical protein